MKRKFTGKQLIEAMELNGYPKSRGVMVKDYIIDRRYGHLNFKSRILSACALGQGMLNLGVHEKDFMEALYEIGLHPSYVYAKNDNSRLKPAEVIKYLRDEHVITQEMQNREVILNVEEKLYTKYSNYQGIKVQGEPAE